MGDRERPESTDHGRKCQEEKSRILALWAVPRSMSTAFEKAISGSPDVEIVHEPFTDCYYFCPQRRSKRYGDSVTVEKFDRYAAMELITNVANATPSKIFFKELAFQAFHYVDNDFMLRIANTFIIRHPARVISSLLRLKPDFTEEELGFHALNDLYDRVTSLTGKPPSVIEGEQFRANPQKTLKSFCSNHGIRYTNDMLNWGSGLLRPWLPHEVESQKKWHATLENSQTILPPTSIASSIELSQKQAKMYTRAREIYDKMLNLSTPQTAELSIGNILDRS